MSGADGFHHSIGEAVSVFQTHASNGDLIRIVSHNDADGISSGGILTAVAHRLGANFHTSIVKKLDDKTIKSLAEEKAPLIVFSDFGSGYLDELREQLDTDIIILDHHMPQETKHPGVTHVNPMLHGIDGSREISAAGVCYLFAKQLNPRNRDLSPLAVVGALGDQQDKGERQTLIGMNTLIEEDAADASLLRKHIGLVFYGYETRHIAKAISYTTDPFIPGLSGDEGNCVAFLRRIGLELETQGRVKSLADLDTDETKMLFSALSSHMLSSGCSGDSIHKLLGTIYTLTGETTGTSMRSGREYGSLLNACGRMGRPGVGVAVCLGDRVEAVDEAHEALETYRRSIAESLDWVQNMDGVKERANIYVIQAGDSVPDTVIGVVSGILLSQGLLKAEKPIVSTAVDEEGQLKVSARSIESLVERGLHMGKVMQAAAELVEGGGGGHDIAAGAFIPAEREEEFMDEVDRLVGEQIK